MAITVISAGGSIIVPEKPDPDFLSLFRDSMAEYLSRHSEDRLIFVIGGGATARMYQEAAKKTLDNADPDILDWIGIRTTHLNATLVKAAFSAFAPDDIVTDPTDEDLQFTGRVLIAGGWKPGFSTDTDAVYLARRFNAGKVINLSNIEKVYTDDPRKNPDAKPIDSISWKDFRKIVGDEWVPGKNTPFDPVASRLAEETGIQVICAEGHNIENTIAILEGQPFKGTTIGA